jgi:tetratricopeptide (TPR) repeat protein
VVSNVSTIESSYDVFLSYNSVDHAVVEDVARKLREAGLAPFLDRWYLAPGARWRPKLEQTLSACRSVAIFVGPGEMGSWQQREVDVALDLQGRCPNLPVIPVLLPGCEPPLGFLRQLTWVDLRTQTLDRGVPILSKAARGEPPGPDLQRDLDSVRASICPYRGLLHFREEDAPFFFGREAAIDQLARAVQRQPFVAVAGASGSGKSSVVRAGLVPRLRSDRRTGWETVILVPTDQPLKALARALVPLLEPTMGEVDRLAQAAKLAEHLRSGTISLYDIVERILEKQPGTDRVLIIVDQFEELYTLMADEEAGRRFLDELLSASAGAGSKAGVALTVRGDFVGRTLAYRPLSDRLQDAQINLGPMTRQELESAIRKPAEKIQLEFESGLVRRILDAVGDEPGNLPLLEFVLKELWEKRRGRVLLNEVYDAIGGLRGAVATKADELFRDLSLPEQKILQRVFLRIVRPSESGLDTRRRAAFTELPPESVDLVIKLANERLLVTNQSASAQTVEVAHEALISNWDTLRSWVNEDREFLLWRERLGTLLKEWERAEESVETLLRGPLLIEAQKWFDRRSQDLSDQERKFISASRVLRERLVREERERQEREIEAARELAKEQKSRAELSEAREKEQKEAARKLRRRAIVAAGAAIAALILLVMSVLWWRAAQKQARIANVQRKAAQAQAQIAETRRLDAQVSEKKANDARDQADGLINFMLFDLHDKLEPIGRLAILDEIAKRSKEYLDTLPKELVTPSRLEQQAAMLDNLGDVRSAQGKLREALDAYQQGLKIRQTLVERNHSNGGWKRDLSVSYGKVGDVLAAQGKLREALNLYQQSLDIRQTLAQQDTSNAGWQRDLSVSHEKVGHVLVAQGKLQEALDLYQRSLNIRQTLTSQDQSNPGWQRDLSTSYEKVGDVLVAQGKLQGALNAYQQSLGIRRTLASQDKSNPDRQRDLSVSYNNVGGVRVAQGKLQEALDLYQQGLKIRQTLADQDQSNSDWQRDLSVSYADVGDVLVAQGKLQDGLEAYQQALAIFERLAAQDQSDSRRQGDLSVSHSKVGNVLLTQGKLQEALDACQQALAISKRLVEQDQSNSGRQRDLAVSYNKVGDILVAQGKLREALDTYQQSLKVLQTLAEQDRSNSDWQRELSVSYEKTGDVLVAQGKLQEALDACRQGLSITKRLAGQDQSNSGWQQDLAVSYNKVGDVLAAQGKLQEALNAYQQSLQILQTLAAQDESNSGWQRELSVNYVMVGNVLSAQGKLPEALDAARQGLAIAKRLAEQDESNARWQHDLSLSYDKVGDVEAALGRLQDALDAYQQDLAITKRMAEQDKSNPDRQRELIVSLYKVGTTTAKIAGSDNVTRAEEFLRTGLSLAELYPGPDRPDLVRALNLALQSLVRSD